MVARRFLLATVLWASCSGGGGQGLPLPDFQAESTRAFCEKALRCGGVFAARYNGDLQTCLAAQQARTGLAPSNLVLAGVAEGVVYYDAQAAQVCLDEYVDGECDPTGLGGWPYCSPIGQGLLGVGEHCTQDMLCATGWCDLTAGCPGVCGETLPPDAACEYTAPCAWHQACIEWQCVTFSTAILTQDEPCDSAQVSGRCASGLTCDVTAGSCQPLPAVGEQCVWTFGCAPGLVCSEQGLCAEVSTATAEGQACDDNVGPFCDWSAGLGCRRNLDTAAWLDCVGFAGLGEACLVQDELLDAPVSIPCDAREPLFCGSEGLCRPLGQTGDSCLAPAECVSRICDVPTGLCVGYTVDLCFGD